MDEKTKATLTNMDTWKRGLFMILFAIISGVAKLVVTLVAMFQFITLLFKGQVNEAMIPFAQNLSTYLYQITLFFTFKTDEMPFPFIPFPDGAPESPQNADNEEDSAETIPTAMDSSESATKNDEEIVDVVDEDIKAEKDAKKATKDDSLKE